MVSLVTQVDQEAAVLVASAEMQVAQETLLPLLHLKEITVEQALRDLVFQELGEVAEAAELQLLEQTDLCQRLIQEKGEMAHPQQLQAQM